MSQASFGSTSARAVIETEAGWLLPTADQSIDQLRLDHALGIMWEAASVRIEQSFELEVDGVIHRLTPEIPDDLALTLPLLHRSILGVVVLRTGVLEMTLADARLVVHSDPNYEAWQAVRNRQPGFMFVCMPGGELAIWNDPPEGPGEGSVSV